jgi:predicted phosphodiesterase
VLLAKPICIFTVADTHTPYNIPLAPILNYCSDLAPDIVQYLGDITSAESCNWRKITKNIDRDVESVEGDYELLRNRVLDPFNKAKPKKSKTIYHIGNHEGWFYEKMKMDKTTKGKLGLENNLDLKKYNMTLVKENGIINFGHLFFTHSTYLNDNHSKKTAQNYRKCLLYGHTHDIQSYMMHSPIDSKEKILAKSIGCLCNHNPEYLEGRPNKWVNSFNVAFVRADGTFNEYDIIITGGKFTALNGKVYK